MNASRKRLIGLGVALAMLVVTLLGSQHTAGADERTSFTVTGRCAWYASGLLVELERAEGVVPLPVLNVGGKALVALIAMDCETSVDGGPIEGSIVTLVGVFTDPARSPAGCQMYDFHWGEDIDGPWVSVFSELEHAVEIQPGSRFASTLGAIDVEVTGNLAPWSMSAVTQTVEAPLPFPSVHCHMGGRGLVRSTYDHTGIVFTPAAGELVLGQGPLWEALGAQTWPSVAPGLSATFDYVGLIELVPPEASQEA